MQRALDYANAHRPGELEELIRLCSQPSVSATGNGIREAAALVEEMMKEVGLTTRVVQRPGAHPVVLGSWDGGRERTVIFYNHYDVQPPEPLEEWHSDPFSPEVRDGKLYARGVSDNKGDLAARLQAIKAYLAAEGSLPVNVRIMAEGEEEIGSAHLPQYLQDSADFLRGDVAIWEGGERNAHGALEMQLGCKGLIYIELIVRGASTDLHSSLAAIVPNPAWRLQQVLACLKDVANDRVLVDGFYDRVRPPTQAEEELLVRFPLDEDTYRRELGLTSFIGNLTGLDLAKKLLYQPTCNIAGIVAGYTGPGSKTVLPREARVKIDFRLVPDQDADEILRRVRLHIARCGFNDVEVLVHGVENPSQTPVDHPAVPVVVETARATYGTEPVVQPRFAGTGPMALFTRIGVPSINGPGVGYYGSRVHAPDENIRVQDYFLGIEHLIRFLDAYARTHA